MSEAEVTVEVKAPVKACFEFIAEPSNTPRFMRGITRYEPIGSRSRGKGARFDSRAMVAGKAFDVELEVTDWKANQRMVATSRKGPKTRGSWTFEALDDATTAVTMLYEYDLPLVFKFVPGVNGIIRDNLEKSLEKMRRLVEAEAKRTRKTRS